MIKVFRNHVCLCTFTTALLSLLQNGVGLCETTGITGEVSGPYEVSVTHHKGSPYNITVISMPPNGFPPLVPPIISSIQTRVFDRDGNNYNNFEIYSPYSSHSRQGGINNIPNIEVIPINPTDPFASISVDSEYVNGGYSGLDGREIPDPHNSIAGQNYNRLSGASGEREENEPIRVRYAKIGRNGKPKLIVSDGLYYICDNCKADTIENRSYKITDKSVSRRFSNIAISVKGENTKVEGKNVTISSQVPGKSFKRGVSVSEGGKVILKNLNLKNTDVALHASNGTIELENGVIDESQMAVRAIGNNTSVVLRGTEIKTKGKKASLYSYDGAEIKMNEGSIDFAGNHGVSSLLGGKIKLDDVKITGKGNSYNHAVFLLDVGGSVDFKGIIDVTDVHGILSENTIDTFNSIPLRQNLSEKDRMTEVNIKSSSVTVNGDESYGIYFRGERSLKQMIQHEDKENSEQEKKPPRLEVVNLATTTFSVLDGTAIFSKNMTHGVVSLSQSSLSGNSLLQAERGASVKILADASTLKGNTHVNDDATAELYLSGESQWILQQKQQKEPREVDLREVSSLSLVSLMGDSSIRFEKQRSASTYAYQTLHIGKGMGEVYKAQDGAHIYLNTYLDEGGSIEKQKTDRVLIYGDVSGETTVHVRGTSGSPGGTTGSGGNNQGISIIQISGEADANSFQLEGGYTTLEHSPYQYRLYAYGPKSDLGKADSSQRLVAGNGEFWDFRLENRYIKPQPEPKPGPQPEPKPGPQPEPEPEPEIKAVVPQVPTYLLLPNALFHTDLMNIANQSKRLEALRIASGEGEMRESPTLFMNGYGGSHRYLSNLSAAEYGYGGELDYNTFEAGVLLQTIENAYGTASFGVVGTYERLSLQPLDVEQSQKSAFDKWTATAYGTMQHDTGFYVDGLFSYGLFNGDVSTLARGKTATLKGNPLSASLASGKAFVLEDKGLILDPQVQIIYQRLQFNKTRDIDDFDIEMNKLDQWVARVGGRLTKTFTATDEARVVSFYGKLHLNHGLRKKQVVHFKDAFQLGDFGSSLETGLGFNAQLSQKFALHGDLVYQHKLTKAGFSGTSFSGGLRYHF